MSKKFIPKRKFSMKKNSSGEQSSKLLKTLQKMIVNKEGSVNFIRVSERLTNLQGDFKDIKDIKNKSIHHLNLNPYVFEKRTPNEIIHLLESIKHDLGADYFEIV